VDAALQEKPANITEIAKKQRYLYLLGKVKQSKQLNSSEIRELESYEKMAKKPKKTTPKETAENVGRKPGEPLQNGQHEKFCHEYIIDSNRTRAYKDVYKCSLKAAESGGSRLLRNAKVQERIKELEKPAIKKAEVTAERVIDELAKIGFSDITDFLRMQGENGISLELLENLPRELTACISEITEYETVTGLKRYKFKLHDKVKALELLGKTNTLNLFAENINHRFPEGCGVLAVPVGMDKKQWSQFAKKNQSQSKKK